MLAGTPMAKPARSSLLLHLVLAALCLVGGCGASTFAILGITVVAASGGYPGYGSAVQLWLIPAVLGLVAAVAVLLARRSGTKE
jgi:hypothetical protein